MHERFASLAERQTARAACCFPLQPASRGLTERPLHGRFGGTIGRSLAYPLIRAWESSAPEGIPGLRQDGRGSRVGWVRRRDFPVPGASSVMVRVAQSWGRRQLVGKKTPQTSRGRLRQMFIASQVAKSLVMWRGAELVAQYLQILSFVRPRMASRGCRPGRASNSGYRYRNRPQQPASPEHFGTFLAGLTNPLFPVTQGWGA
jgi:hypothetical protein